MVNLDLSLSSLDSYQLPLQNTHFDCQIIYLFHDSLFTFNVMQIKTLLNDKLLRLEA